MSKVTKQFVFFFSSRRRHTRWTGDWSSDVCSSDLRRERVQRPGDEQPARRPQPEFVLVRRRRRGPRQLPGEGERRAARVLAGRAGDGGPRRVRRAGERAEQDERDGQRQRDDRVLPVPVPHMLGDQAIRGRLAGGALSRGRGGRGLAHSGLATPCRRTRVRCPMISANKITGITATWMARSAVKLAGLNRWKKNGSTNSMSSECMATN